MGTAEDFSLKQIFQSIQPFLDLISEKIVILNRDGEIVFVNHSFKEKLSVDLNELSNITVERWFPEWEKLQENLETGKSQIVHLQNLDTRTKMSLRMSFVEKIHDQYLILFTDPWQPIKSTRNLSELILNHLKEAYIFVDTDYQIRAFNNEANLLTIKRTQEPLVYGAKVMDYFQNEGDWEILESQIRIAFTGKRSSFYLSDSNLSKVGSQYEFMAVPLRDVQEEILGVLLIHQVKNDIQHPIKIDFQTNPIIQTLSAIRYPSLLWERKEKGKSITLTQANSSAEKFFSPEINDQTGMLASEFFRTAPDVAKALENCLENGNAEQLEIQLDHWGGDFGKWTLIDFLKLSDNSVLMILVDIDEQRKVEEELRENQRQLTTLFENLPGMAYRCRHDADWTMEFVSAGVEDLTGFPNEDLINNRKISYANLIHPEDRHFVWNTIQKALDQRQKFEMRYRIQVANQQEKWVWEKGQGIFKDTGELIAIEGFISDVTAQVISEMEAEKALLQTQALKQALEEMTTQLDLSQVLRRILVSLETVLGFDSATLFLGEEGKLKVVAARGFGYTSRLINKTFPATDQLLIEIQNKKEPIILEDAQKDPRFNHWEGSNHVRGWMGVPLIRHDNFIGLMTLDNNNPGAYSEEDAKLALSFANSASIVIENARLFEQTQQMALTDTLTGIYNRRYFYELSQKEFARSKRYQDPLSIIMIDIDHFKNINDKFGHLAGDQVLVQFVQRIQSELRESDVFGRFGGEEFIILLPETNLGDATQVAERLREVTEEYPFLLVTAQTFITISLGVTCYRFTSVSLDQLIDESDKALYEAKQLGRNRVRVWQHNR